MASAQTPSRLALPLAVALLGTSAMWLELLSFRLDAAVYGWGFARVLAALAPAFGGAVAAWATSRRRPYPGRADAAGAAAFAAYATGVAATGCGAAAVGLTWGSQRFAKLDGSWVPLAVTASIWMVTAAGLGSAVASVLRANRERVGRLSFALAVGAAVGALLVPAAMWLGAPRALLVAGLGLAAAALLLAHEAAAAQPKLSYLATLPLALGALLAGDIGAPWLRLRSDVGRRGRVGISAWTADGLVQIDNGKQGVVPYNVDHGPLGWISLQQKDQRRQGFELPDMAYFLNGSEGAALVLASGGAREIREAVDSGHARVDAVEPSVSIPKVLLGELATEAGPLIRGDERVTLRIGDGRAQLARLRDRYERVIVVGDTLLAPAPQRLLVDGYRLFTAEAFRGYLARLAEPRGVLLARVSRAHLPHLLATAADVAGKDALAQRAVACAERKDDGMAGVLIFGSHLNGPERHNVEKSCKRRGLDVEFPIESHAGDREPRQREQDQKLAVLGTGVVIHDDRPFYDRPPPIADLRRAARESLRAMPATEPPKTSTKPKPGEKEPAKPPVMTTAGIAMSATGLALTLLLLAVAAPIARGERRGTPVAFRCGPPLFGVASGLTVVALDDHLLRLLGGGDWAWPVVIPVGAVGIGAGRLLTDCASERAQGRVLGLTALIGAGVLGMLAVAGPRLALATDLSLTVRLGVVLVTLLLVGGLVGAPIAAAMRIGGRFGSAAIGWAWAAQLSGMAFGAAAAQLAARYVGVSRLFLAAAVSLGLGALFASSRGGR